MTPRVRDSVGMATTVGQSRWRLVIGHTIKRGDRTLKARSERTTAGRRPACSGPSAGSQKTQRMSPASGAAISLFAYLRAVWTHHDLAAGVFVVNDFRTYVPPPVDCFWRVLPADAVSLGH